jgi:hypothetical protein
MDKHAIRASVDGPVGGYKFDVAFSFLSQDEGLAMQLNDLLQDRVKTFVYPERQKELAGTDGEETFGKVFREEARLVVVLYRVGWGETKWTRVEQAAIRARGFEHGYSFAKFIPLDEPAHLPPWLPPTQIYIGLRRFGIEGAAAVIEERIRDLGGQAHQETIEERAKRLERQAAFEARRHTFRSGAGVKAANVQLGVLKQAVAARAAVVNASTSMSLQTGEREGKFWLVGLGRALGLLWRQKYSNTLSESQLDVRLFDSLPPTQWMFEKPSTLMSLSFTFDLLPSDVGGWISADARHRSFSSEELAEHLVRFYLENGRPEVR